MNLTYTPYITLSICSRTRNVYPSVSSLCPQGQVCLVPVTKHGMFTKQKESFQYSELLKSRQVFQALPALLSSLTVLSPLIVSLTYSKLPS